MLRDYPESKIIHERCKSFRQFKLHILIIKDMNFHRIPQLSDVLGNVAFAIPHQFNGEKHILCGNRFVVMPDQIRFELNIVKDSILRDSNCLSQIRAGNATRIESHQTRIKERIHIPIDTICVIQQRVQALQIANQSLSIHSTLCRLWS